MYVNDNINNKLSKLSISDIDDITDKLSKLSISIFKNAKTGAIESWLVVELKYNEPLKKCFVLSVIKN